jgi:hypothetical protein
MLMRTTLLNRKKRQPRALRKGEACTPPPEGTRGRFPRDFSASAASARGSAVAALLALIGCNSIAGLDDFQLQSNLPAGSTCIDPSAFAGRGCFSCSPTDARELLNACTSTLCSPFDNGARIPGFGAGTTPVDPTVVELPPAPPAAPPTSTGTVDETLMRCADLTPKPVYVYGSSALNLALRTLSQAISTTATIVYQNDTSCPGLDAILTGLTRLKGAAQYWAPDQNQPIPCQIDGEQLADIGLCDVSPSSCIPEFAGNNNLVDDLGPAQVFMFTVPGASSQTAISAEAAYAVYGYDDAGVEPWIDPASLIRRGGGSGVQLTIAASLGLEPAFWRGVIKQRSSEVKPGLLMLADPERALGITSADVADEADARANLRTLAYQHFDQGCAFTPDSSVGSSDKRNVRDGHYELWAPLHFYTRGPNGRTQDPFVSEIVSYLTGARSLPNRNTDFITTLKQGGLVPTCAMRVTRSSEGARIEPFEPSPSCSCYFDASPPGGVVREDCVTCTTSAQCPSTAPNCSFGYCEP